LGSLIRNANRVLILLAYEMVLPATYNPAPFAMSERNTISRPDPALERDSSPSCFVRLGVNPVQREGASVEQCARTLPARTAFWVKSSQALYLCLRSTFLLLLGASALFAQRHTLEVSQFAHASWTARDGFFKGAGSVAQTSDGYIWIASPTGLLRFDGVRFFEWKPPGKVGITSTGWKGETPLWYYVLREADACTGGQRLGPVGGRIVVEVLVGLIDADATSFRRSGTEWRPQKTPTGLLTS
jgi:hypothetical protein